MTNPFIQIEQVSKKIGKQQIVHPFSLKLEAGQTLALCGGNGAGKSTLLRMIAGIMQPSEGQIMLDGLQWKNNRKAYAELIGFMPDDFRFGTALSAWETITFYASLRGIGKQRAAEVLRLVELYEARHKSVAAFSKGMRQRLMFGQAVLAKPKLLMMDEPTNGLDPYWTDMFSQLVLELKAAGTTIIFSTHHLQIAETVADEALFLHEGRIMSHRTIAEYRESYGSAGLAAVFTESSQQSIASK